MQQLWEMACAKNLGFVHYPIICVNIDGYYEPFRMMLQRAYEDELLKVKPENVIHFTNTSIEAIQYIETQVGMSRPGTMLVLRERTEAEASSATTCRQEETKFRNSVSKRSTQHLGLTLTTFSCLVALASAVVLVNGMSPNA